LPTLKTSSSDHWKSHPIRTGLRFSWQPDRRCRIGLPSVGRPFQQALDQIQSDLPDALSDDFSSDRLMKSSAVATASIDVGDCTQRGIVRESGCPHDNLIRFEPKRCVTASMAAPARRDVRLPDLDAGERLPPFLLLLD